MTQDTPRFSFGKNWERYIESSFSEERLKASQNHLLSSLGVSDLVGKHFLDIGSGSGLHSLAAHRAGAKRVVSFDYDEHAVLTTAALRSREGSPENWEVLQGSILDREFVASLELADIVYSWGVLHHTGSMWKAVTNAAGLMREDGVFYVALYTTSHKSPYWIRTKQAYNHAGDLGKRWMEVKYLLRHRLLADLKARKSTLRVIRERKQQRGMEFMTDVRDWLGGWPYEDASIDEVVDFTYEKLNLQLTRIITGEACTEYIFKQHGQP